MAFMSIMHLKKTLVLSESPVSVEKLNGILAEYGIEDDLYFTQNGKRLELFDVRDGVIHALPRLRGGKGGFGSMLRAIGAQIEKTTNREACRDLSGRRLRDINEEKRLKNWIAQQADREREVAEKRKKKLERLCAEPKHEFKDKEYEKQRSDLTEKVWDAVDQGMKASTSGCGMASSSQKRKHSEPKKPAKKSCLWVGDIDDISSCDSDDSDEDSAATENPLEPSVKTSVEVKGNQVHAKNSCETTDLDSHSEKSTEVLERTEGGCIATDENSETLGKSQGNVKETTQGVLAI